MITRSEKIDSDESPQELNQILIRDYGYDLFDFTYSLAITLSKKPPLRLWNIWLIRKAEIVDFEILKRELTRLKKIRNNLIKDLKKHLFLMSQIENTLLPKEFVPGATSFESLDDKKSDNNVASIYGIQHKIGSEIDSIQAIINIFKRTKGPPASVKNILGSLWSLVLRDETSIHIDVIAELTGWFYERLKPRNYADELKASPSLEYISRFMSRFGSMIEEDRTDIFYHNLKLEQNINKIFPFQIVFDDNGARFFSRDSDENQTSLSKIIFPDDTEF